MAYGIREFGQDVGGTAREVPGVIGKNLKTAGGAALQALTLPGRGAVGLARGVSEFGSGLSSGLAGETPDPSRAVATGQIKRPTVQAVQAPEQQAPRLPAAASGVRPGAGAVAPTNFLRNEQTGEVTTFESQPVRYGALQKVRMDQPEPMSPADKTLGTSNELIYGKSASQAGGAMAAMLGLRMLKEYKGLKPFDIQQAEERGRGERAGLAEAGHRDRLEREYALRREAAGEERGSALSMARERLYGAQAGTVEQQLKDAQERGLLEQRLQSEPEGPGRDRLVQYYQTKFGSKEPADRSADIYSKLIAAEMPEEEARRRAGFAGGGLVRGYADGGAVGRDLAQPAPQVNPLIAQYGQYLTAAASAGVPPVPFTQYQNLLQTTRGSMQEQPPVGFADGGDVSALGRTLEGPGTGTSDSIPAVIDGQQPAALSKDEFVFPAEVTKYYGTKFMNDLIAKAKAALSGEGATANG